MKGQLSYKTLLFVVCSLFATSNFAQSNELPTLPPPISADIDLPLTLISFSAALKSGTAQLYWKTSNEVNVNNFTVERSVDGQLYQSTGIVLAKNSIANSYEFSDNITIQNVAYYRLKMIDKDGSFQYSATIVVKSIAISKLSIYPNPARNFVTVTHGVPHGNANISIINIAGTRVQTIPVNSSTQQTSFIIGNSIMPGIYSLQYIDDTGVQSVQFMKL